MRSRYTASCRASSPLTRGKRGARHDLVDCVRLIPAHTGKTTRVARLPGDCSQVGWLPPSYVGLFLLTREYTTPDKLAPAQTDSSPLA